MRCSGPSVRCRGPRSLLLLLSLSTLHSKMIEIGDLDEIQIGKIDQLHVDDDGRLAMTDTVAAGSTMRKAILRVIRSRG